MFRLWWPVIVGALGYFVDIYDLVLFSIVRVASLKDLGVGADSLLSVGVLLLNSQMAGMLVGGILWGVLGDKRGRLSVLFGSILLYSIANIANGLVTGIGAYAALRFIAGVGLAGELGAAVTLVSETLPTRLRGYGTSLIAGIGVLGAIAAGYTAEWFSWRYSYIVGGTLGLTLLILRISMAESKLFGGMSRTDRKGDLRMLLGSSDRILRYLSCILIGIPIWYVVGILMTFSPEISKELGVLGPIQAGTSIMWCYGGLAVGDVFSGFLSQWMRSRRRVLLMFIVMTAVVSLSLLLSEAWSPSTFYWACGVIGFTSGYWAIFVTVSAEHFGTNLRATVATSVPNFVRGAVVPLTLSFQWLSSKTSLVWGAVIVGFVCFAMALTALRSLRETHATDLDFLEQ